MLSTMEASIAVFDAEEVGILAGVSAGKVIIDCATLSPERMIEQVYSSFVVSLFLNECSTSNFYLKVLWDYITYNIIYFIYDKYFYAYIFNVVFVQNVLYYRSPRK